MDARFGRINRRLCARGNHGAAGMRVGVALEALDLVRNAGTRVAGMEKREMRVTGSVGVTFLNYVGFFNLLFF